MAWVSNPSSVTSSWVPVGDLTSAKHREEAVGFKEVKHGKHAAPSGPHEVCGPRSVALLISRSELWAFLASSLCLHGLCFSAGKILLNLLLDLSNKY